MWISKITTHGYRLAMRRWHACPPSGSEERRQSYCLTADLSWMHTRRRRLLLYWSPAVADTREPTTAALTSEQSTIKAWVVNDQWTGQRTTIIIISRYTFAAFTRTNYTELYSAWRQTEACESESWRYLATPWITTIFMMCPPLPQGAALSSVQFHLPEWCRDTSSDDN